MGSRELRPRGRDACTSRWDYHGWTEFVVASQQWCRKCIGLHYATCWRTGCSSTSQVHSAVEIIVCVPVHLPLEETPAVGHHLLWPLVVAASRCRSPWWIHHGERTMNLWLTSNNDDDGSVVLPPAVHVRRKWRARLQSDAGKRWDGRARWIGVRDVNGIFYQV